MMVTKYFPIYFYLEESTGYMQPTLAFLAALHTVISFICIIGYNCLKVHGVCCACHHKNPPITFCHYL